MPEKVFVTGADNCTHPEEKEIKKSVSGSWVYETVQVRHDEGDGIQRCGDCGKVWKD